MNPHQAVLQRAILRIIRAIKKGCVFDSHYVISRLIKRHSDDYLIFASGVTARSGYRTMKIHELIAKMIDRLPTTIVQRQDFDSFSENIHGEVHKCACWRVLPKTKGHLVK
jgi:hypothetical protein